MKQEKHQIKNIADNPSWFRDTPHRWASASLPLAYAIACVEVVAKNSKKAGAIYDQIVEAWENSGVKAISREFLSDITDSKKEEIKQALIHPENAFLPDPNKPFKDIEEIFATRGITRSLPPLPFRTTKGGSRGVCLSPLNLPAQSVSYPF